MRSSTLSVLVSVLIRIGRYAIGAYFARRCAGRQLFATIHNGILIRFVEFHFVQQIGIGHLAAQLFPNVDGHVFGGAGLQIERLCKITDG